MAKHPNCLFRIASVLTSCIGRVRVVLPYVHDGGVANAMRLTKLFSFSQPEASRIAVAILCNISMNRQTFAYFLPIEKDLLLVACSDRSVSDILNNVVADVYGMHSL